MRYFLDTEFIEDGKTIELASIGLVAEDGRELYAQFEIDYTRCDDWFARNVLPYLSHFDMGKRQRSCGAELVGPNQKPLYGGRCVNVGTADPCCWWRRDLFKEALLNFLFPTPETPKPTFYTWYGDYDWVAFCQLFGRMVDLPDMMPKFAYDLRQYWADTVFGVAGIHAKEEVKQEGTVHNALEDARWNLKLFNHIQAMTKRELP